MLASVLERWSVHRYGTWALVEVIQAIAGAAARLAPVIAITDRLSAWTPSAGQRGSPDLQW